MLEKKNWLKHATILLIFAAGIIFNGCNHQQQNKSDEVADDLIDDNVLESVNEAKKIFYALPSPLETAMLIKTSGASYNEELLNSIDNADNYTTNKQMALNLGIYITDLSFASLFDQTQTTINYMSTAKKLADRLGILDAIDNHTIKTLEENINNREVIMDIISETFMSSSSFLLENDRPAISSLMLIGGWVEGLYIATQLVNMTSFEDNRLVERIVDQKLAYEIVIKLMEENKENTNVASIIDDLYALELIFDKIEITSSETQVVEGSDNVAVIKANSESKITREVFDELHAKVSEIRTKFIK